MVNSCKSFWASYAKVLMTLILLHVLCIDQPPKCSFDTSIPSNSTMLSSNLLKPLIASSGWPAAPWIHLLISGPGLKRVQNSASSVFISDFNSSVSFGGISVCESSLRWQVYHHRSRHFAIFWSRILTLIFFFPISFEKQFWHKSRLKFGDL